MRKVIEELRQWAATGAPPITAADVIAQVDELLQRNNQLEELLIMLVRTGWPWDEDGNPNALFHNSKDGFSSTMLQAKKVLGLDSRSSITRTEPKT